MTRVVACPVCDRLVDTFVNGQRCPACREETLGADPTAPDDDS